MYYVRFADLLTDADICEMRIPFKADRRIVQPGSFSSDFEIANPAVGLQVAKIIPQRTIAHVYRTHQLIGSYIIWSKTISGDSTVKCSLQGATLESMFYHRFYVGSSDLTYTSTDQMTIARDLFMYGQQNWMGWSNDLFTLDLDIPVVTSGVLVSKTWKFSDMATIGKMVEDLANVEDGFEYIIHVYDDGTSARKRRLFLGYPNIAAASQPLIVEQPGAIKSFSIQYDGLAGANMHWTRGSSDQSTPSTEAEPGIGLWYNFDYIDNGWPIVEAVHDYKESASGWTLDTYAAWWANNRSGPIVVPSFTLNANWIFDNCGFTPMSIGGPVVYILDNPAFPVIAGVPSMASTSRTIGFELTVESSGDATIQLIAETQYDPSDLG
jgi:hypothetical protein